MNRLLISLVLLFVASVARADTTYQYVERGHRTVRMVVADPNGCGVYIVNYREPTYVRQLTWTPWQQTPVQVQHYRQPRPAIVTAMPVIVNNPFVKEQ